MLYARFRLDQKAARDHQAEARKLLMPFAVDDHERYQNLRERYAQQLRHPPRCVAHAHAKAAGLYARENDDDACARATH